MRTAIIFIEFSLLGLYTDSVYNLVEDVLAFDNFFNLLFVKLAIAAGVRSALNQ